MGSTLKLDLQKRQHRERSQPLNRKKLGLLEKHADYVKRARDFHSKEDRIKKLREKAASRNKDEFYFGMIRSKTVKGIHQQSRGNEALPTDLVKVLKTQDAGYIRTQTAMEDSRVKRLEMKLQALMDTRTASTSKAPVDEDDDDFMFDFDEPSTSTAAAPKRNHIMFTSNLDAVRNGDVAALKAKKPKAASTTTPALSSKRSRKGKGKAVATPEDLAAAEKEESERSAAAIAHRETLEAELAARKERLSALQRATRELEVQRMLMGRGARQALVPRKEKQDPRDVVDDWGDESSGGKGALPDAQDGIKTGARVWKWKAQRKR